MNTVEAAKKFVFNAMLVEDSLFDMQEKGVPIKEGIEISPISRVVDKDFNPIIWRQAVEMSSVYTIIYCIENTLRSIIIDRLSERKGLSWWGDCVSSRIKKAAENIKKNEEVYKYISSRGDALIYYTLLDDLADIITANWDEFSDIIPDQSWIKSRMTDLTKCRNIVMHTGVLPQFEIDRIESIARDFIRHKEREDTLLPALRQQLAETEKGIDNLLNAIQQGLFNTSAKKRLDDLEAQKEELEISILQAEMNRPKYTKEEMVLWISQFKYGDVNSLDYQRKIIDIFVNSIRLDDDKIIFTHNYKDGTETISLNDIEGSDLLSGSPPSTRLVSYLTSLVFCRHF